MSAKPCDCLSKIEAALMREYGAGNFEMQLSHWFNFDTGVSESWLPPLHFQYHKKKPDGSRDKKVSKSFFKFTHCPFCGTKQAK